MQESRKDQLNRRPSVHVEQGGSAEQETKRVQWRCEDQLNSLDHVNIKDWED